MRGTSAKELLKLDWDFPVWPPEESARAEGTQVKPARQALSREDALRYLAGKDARPLLVLRECSVCNKTDNALLTPGLDNEKTLFFTRWFHCVKLPVDVIEADHPFNALFPNNDAEHLFVSAVDGSNKLPLEAETSRVELWSAMSKVLAAAYSKDPSLVYRDVHALLDKLDVLDARQAELEAKRLDIMESASPDAVKLRKVQAELDQTKKEIAAQRLEVERQTKLELKPAGGVNRAPAQANH